MQALQNLLGDRSTAASRGGVHAKALLLPGFVVLMLAMMVLPLPPLVLDLLFTFNIALALMVMMISAQMVKPLDFAALPTVLLVTTLMRLSLNVASTRVVLMEGHTGPGAAGKVIEAFGHFLIGGNFAVGLIVFFILVVINFVVVTKGAERIAEVGARFALDAMPGKQMAIDADLNAGLIDEKDARRRRAEVGEEADFFGSMDGASKFVRGDAIAGLIIVAAKTGAGTSLFAVAGDAAGITKTNLSTMDQTRKQAKLDFANTPAELVGEEGQGWNTLETVLDLAAVALAAEQVGGAQKVLEMAVDYAKVRVQFGRPIGSFQAIKHKCADMLLEVESAKSAAYYGMWCASEMNDELPSTASLAKAYCSEAYFHAAAENIQIHGGIGFTWEHPAHLYFKRAKSSELLFGDPTYHREQLAQRIGI